MPHKIRLRGPWELRSISFKSTDDGPFDSASELLEKLTNCAPSTPDSIAGELTGGRTAAILLTRFFNRPTNLSQGDEVSLHLPLGRLTATAFLNSAEIGRLGGEQTPAEPLPINGHLSPRNRVDLLIDAAQQALHSPIELANELAHYVTAVVEKTELLIETSVDEARE